MSTTFMAAAREHGLDVPPDTLVAPPGQLADLRQLAGWARREAPDVLYTVFGPAYVPTPGVRQVCGFARGWMLWPNTVAAQVLPLRPRVRRRLSDLWKVPFLRVADEYIVESPAAVEPLAKLAGRPTSAVHVVSNTCADVFRTSEATTSSFLPAEARGKRLVLSVASYYRHKNLEIIPAVAQSLASRGRDDVCFLVTLAPDHPAWLAIQEDARRRGVADRVLTLGRVPLAELPGLYSAADVCLLPTLIETFSASYPEAWSRDCPVVTTDLAFARGLCADAALYYSALDAGAAASALEEALDTPATRTALVAAGRARLAELPDSAGRVEAIASVLRGEA